MSNFAFEEEQLAEKLNFGVWKRIFKYAIQWWYLLVFLAVTMVFTSFHDSSFVPLMNRAAIKAIQQSAGLVSLADLSIKVELFFGITFNVSFWQFGALLIGAMLIRSLSIFSTFFITNYLEMKIMVAMRRDSFRRVQELSFSYFDRTSSGWIIARMQNDTSKISDILSWGIIRIIWITFDLVLSLITMFSISWQMSLIILASTPLIMIIAPYFETTILKLSRTARTAYSGFVGWLAECIAGAKTIKTLAIENSVQDEADDIITDVNRKYFRTGKTQSFFQPSVSIVAALTTAAIIIFGYQFIPVTIVGTETIVDVSMFILFIGFVGQVYNPIQEFAEIFGDVMGTQASVEKILSLIETKPEIVDTPEVIAKYGGLFDGKTENYEPLQGDIEFRHLSFSYLKDTEVIHDMNLKIKKGQSIAIVGETGSGKSTTVNLLCRFYEPTQGELLIDGVDYRQRSIGWLRSNIGYVQQTPFIFSGTIKDNIRYGKLNATDEEIIQAAKTVEVHDFIMSQPKGYDTVLEDGGNELSVGQKQLISFARAIVRNPAIMILDEATSSIDTETEAIIQAAIRKVLVGRTSVIIAHRLSTVVDCDRILVMSEGKIIEDGSHRELLSQNGTYHKLYMNQFAELKVEAQIDTYESQVKGILKTKKGLK